MKINYNKNPLCTTIELTEHEKEVFKLKIRIKELEEMIFTGHWTLKHHDWWNKTIAKDGKDKPVRSLQDTMNEAMDELDPNYIFGDEDGKSKFDKRVDELFDYFMADLESSHMGDCVCFACSCSKCHAEELLGVNTIKGLGKHSAHKIDSAFGPKNEKSLDEVLEHLQNYNPTPPQDMTAWDKVGGWAQHLPRWKDEARKAYDWLLAYKNEHFPTS